MEAAGPGAGARHRETEGAAAKSRGNAAVGHEVRRAGRWNALTPTRWFPGGVAQRVEVNALRIRAGARGEF